MADASTAKPAVKKQRSKHHYLRTPLASILGSLAAALIVLSIVVLWLGRTLTDTNAYVDTVAPLVTDGDVQSFAVDKVSKVLLDSDVAALQGIASELLGPEQIQGKTIDELREAVRPKVEGTLNTVVASSHFANLWEDTNRVAHETLIQQLNSDSNTVTLDFQPLIDGVIVQLDGTDLGFVKDKIDIQPGTSLVTIESDKFENLRNAYNKIKQAILLLVLLTTGMTISAIAISVHHVKTLRRVAFSTGIFAGLIAIGLSATSLIQFSGPDADQQKLILAIINSVTHSLRVTLFVLAAANISGSVGSKLYEVWSFRQKQ